MICIPVVFHCDALDCRAAVHGTVELRLQLDPGQDGFVDLYRDIDHVPGSSTFGTTRMPKGWSARGALPFQKGTFCPLHAPASKAPMATGKKAR